ncbi:MAG TPA: cytochrome c oxidase subunit I [Ilumatobacteraceae bacterium]|nr:cytochrome c oxidase subunit I [Ilumatobacteraceae bacterium]
MTDELQRTRADHLVEIEAAWSSKPGLPGFLSAVNHKQIGLRFIWTGVAFLLIGGVEAILLRIQLMRADNDFLAPDTYNQLFTMHGTTMMFLFAVPLLEGLAMYLTPLQIGTRDLPFPRLNAFGYWVYVAGGLLLNWSLITGSVPDGGWFAYVPLTGPEFSPSRALDFWLLGVTFVEIAGIVGAIELIVVILRFRAPGMSLGRMPLFVWSVLVMAAMMLVAFPFVVVASTLLELERKFGAPFYDAASGGNPLLWQHLFWIFGHPEVYIMLLPATGVVSAVVAVHVGRRIVAYPLVAASLIGIAIVSFGLWVHHMFAVGLPVMVLALFAMASYFIAIPSGIQVFAWIATIWEGRPRWTAPMWFVVGFFVIFVLGGITGIMVASAPWDLQAHDTFFVVAHFHYVIIGGVVFPMLAALHHWFPKMTGRLPSELVGKVSCAVLFVGFNVTFFPQHWLGLQGMARRVYTYDASLGWETSNLWSTIGSFVLAAGFAVFFGNLAYAWRRGAIAGPDPWRGDTLEWATASPPAAHGHDVIPVVGSLSPQWETGDPGLSADVLDAVGVTGTAWRGRREVIRTSVLDARPEAIVSLPGPSYWPLISTAALTLAIIGVLVDWVLLAAAGGVALLVTFVAWGESNRRAVAADGDGEHDDDLGQARRAAGSTFALHAPAASTAVSMGAWLAVAVVGVLTGGFAYAYYYLRLSATSWPLDGSGPDALGGPALAAVLVVTALFGASTIERGWIRSLLAWLAFAGAVVVQLVSLAASGVSISTDAYGAAVVTLTAWSAIVAGAALVVRGAGVVHAARGHWSASLAEADRPIWIGAGTVWLVLFAIVHLTPRAL